MVEFKPSMYNSYLDLAMKQHRSRAYNLDMSGIVYIAAGMGYNPIDKTHKDFLDGKYQERPGYADNVYANWEKHRDEVLKTIENLPTHNQFLADTIYKPK